MIKLFIISLLLLNKTESFEQYRGPFGPDGELTVISLVRTSDKNYYDLSPTYMGATYEQRGCNYDKRVLTCGPWRSYEFNGAELVGSNLAIGNGGPDVTVIGETTSFEVIWSNGDAPTQTIVTEVPFTAFPGISIESSITPFGCSQLGLLGLTLNDSPLYINGAFDPSCINNTEFKFLGKNQEGILFNNRSQIPEDFNIKTLERFTLANGELKTLKAGGANYLINFGDNFVENVDIADLQRFNLIFEKCIAKVFVVKRKSFFRSFTFIESTLDQPEGFSFNGIRRNERVTFKGSSLFARSNTLIYKSFNSIFSGDQKLNDFKFSELKQGSIVNNFHTVNGRGWGYLEDSTIQNIVKLDGARFIEGSSITDFEEIVQYPNSGYIKSSYLANFENIFISHKSLSNSSFENGQSVTISGYTKPKGTLTFDNINLVKFEQPKITIGRRYDRYGNLIDYGKFNSVPIQPPKIKGGVEPIQRLEGSNNIVSHFENGFLHINSPNRLPFSIITKSSVLVFNNVSKVIYPSKLRKLTDDILVKYLNDNEKPSLVNESETNEEIEGIGTKSKFASIGNMGFFSWEKQSNYINGIDKININYNSRSTKNTSLGNGWSSNLLDRAYHLWSPINGNTIVLEINGSQTTLEQSSNTSYISSNSLYSTSLQTGDDDFLLNDINDKSYIYTKLPIFGSNQIAYALTRKITNTHDFIYEYNTIGQLVKVAKVETSQVGIEENDPVIIFTYNQNGSLINQKIDDYNESYFYDSKGRLVALKSNKELFENYYYEDVQNPNSLTKIMDNNGEVKIVYDLYNRVSRVNIKQSGSSLYYNEQGEINLQNDLLDLSGNRSLIKIQKDNIPLSNYILSVSRLSQDQNSTLYNSNMFGEIILSQTGEYYLQVISPDNQIINLGLYTLPSEDIFIDYDIPTQITLQDSSGVITNYPVNLEDTISKTTQTLFSNNLGIINMPVLLGHTYNLSVKSLSQTYSLTNIKTNENKSFIVDLFKTNINIDATHALNEISLFNENDRKVITVQKDDNNFFQITNLIGNYYLKFTYENINIKSVLYSFPTTEISIDLTNPTTIIVNKRTIPLINQEIEFNSNSFPNILQTSSTNENGLFTIYPLDNETYNLSINTDDYLFENNNIIGGETYTFDIKDVFKSTVNINLSTGEPLILKDLNESIVETFTSTIPFQYKINGYQGDYKFSFKLNDEVITLKDSSNLPNPSINFQISTTNVYFKNNANNKIINKPIEYHLEGIDHAFIKTTDNEGKIEVEAMNNSKILCKVDGYLFSGNLSNNLIFPIDESNSKQIILTDGNLSNVEIIYYHKSFPSIKISTYSNEFGIITLPGNLQTNSIVFEIPNEFPNYQSYLQDNNTIVLNKKYLKLFPGTTSGSLVSLVNSTFNTILTTNFDNFGQIEVNVNEPYFLNYSSGSKRVITPFMSHEINYNLVELGENIQIEFIKSSRPNSTQNLYIKIKEQDHTQYTRSYASSGIKQLSVSALKNETYIIYTNRIYGTESCEVKESDFCYLPDRLTSIITVSDSSIDVTSQVTMYAISNAGQRVGSFLTKDSLSYAVDVNNTIRLIINNGLRDYVSKPMILSTTASFELTDVALFEPEGYEFNPPVILNHNASNFNISYAKEFLLQGTLLDDNEVSIFYKEHEGVILNNQFQIPISLESGIHAYKIEFTRSSGGGEEIYFTIDYKESDCPNYLISNPITNNLTSSFSKLHFQSDGYIKNPTVINNDSNYNYSYSTSFLGGVYISDTLSFKEGFNDFDIYFEDQEKFCRQAWTPILNDQNLLVITTIKEPSKFLSPRFNPYTNIDNRVSKINLSINKGANFNVEVIDQVTQEALHSRLFNYDYPGDYEIELWDGKYLDSYVNEGKYLIRFKSLDNQNPIINLYNIILFY
ncbi:MAG: hypothetical protein COB02_06260 [Candidatus Cloacimonadota bacterium]|nr:MAG: hypothetical protein COB02_06260 [Candidatus Cloacimonadota bacterium]